MGVEHVCGVCGICVSVVGLFGVGVGVIVECVYVCGACLFMVSMMYILSGGQVWRTCLLGSCVV